MTAAYNPLALVNGVPRGAATYDNTTTLVAPVSSGTPVTLPGSQSYTSINQLSIYLNGTKLDASASSPDYSTSGSTPFTAVTFGQNLVTGDVLEFRIVTTF